MPAVAVIGGVVRTSGVRNGSLTTNNNVNGRRDSVTPAWQIPHKPPVAPANDNLHTRQLSAYRRWMSKNKVGHGTMLRAFPNRQRASFVTFNQPTPHKYRETPTAAVVLYMGIGMFLVGLVITFVGIGEKGFNTLELQLIGPCLTGLGLIVCGIRVLICCCAHKCSYCDQPINADEPIQRKSTASSSSRSLQNVTSVRPPLGPKTAQRAMLRSATPVPVPLNYSMAAPAAQLPSTSTSVVETHNNNNNIKSSWEDDSSLDLSSKRDADDSSAFSGDSLDDVSNEFQEVQLKNASPTSQPRVTSPINNSAVISNAIIDTIGDKRNGLANGVVLDPQQYLNRATLAASTKTIR